MRSALSLWMVLLIACGNHEPRAETQVARPSQPSLRLVAFTDLAGYLQPCGCQSRPLGGIDKASARLAAWRADKVPLLFVAAGDLLLGDRPEGATSDEQAEKQETWKAESLVDILNRMGMTAATPGAKDLHYGRAVFDRLSASAKFAWLPPAPGETDPERIAAWSGEVSGVKVGLIGVSTFQGPEFELPNDRLKRLSANAQREIDRLRSDGAAIVIGLLSCDLRSGRRLSANLHGLDFALQGGVSEPSTPPPSRSGDAVLLRAGYQGQGLLVVDVYIGGHGAYADVSPWTRRERDAQLNARIDDLSRRVAAWERDAKVDKDQLDTQRKKLTALRGELAQSAAVNPGDNAFSARIEQLGPELHGDPPIAASMAQYDARVNDYNRSAFADVLPPLAPPTAAHFVGAAACKSCHADAFAWWTRHPHGHAYTTLESVNKQFNLSCVGCHITGYMQPGGSSLVHNEGLLQVGCESCHGPGSQHVAAPNKMAFQPAAAVSESTCKRCHTPERSDLFEYTTYVARLRAPGHGLPAVADTER